MASPIEEYVRRAAEDPGYAEEQIRAAQARVNGNASRNTYISVEGVPFTPAGLGGVRVPAGQRLAGVPVSLKDCFDLKGFVTSCGSRYYATARGPASADSAAAARLKAAGAFIVGKTHLHTIAYGITGENPDYGDCLQPGDAGALTGGSSSGAAASVLEGSALAAIGTDTGGSIRVPAALCGLSGFRCSHGVTDWRGADPLAPSFDTAGWIFRDLRDGPRLASALWGAERFPEGGVQARAARVGCPPAGMMEDCEPSVLASYEAWRMRLERAGAVEVELDVRYWEQAYSIFAPVQAHEASRVHAGLYRHFEPGIAARLEWGASLSAVEVQAWRLRCVEFARQTEALFGRCDFILMPATPIARLAAGEDHGAARQTILRYTAPASVAGLPVALLPGGRGGGMQLMAAHGEDRALVAYAAHLGRLLAEEGMRARPC